MRILTLDIETSPHEAYSFEVWQTNILPYHIIAPTAMLTWAAKWIDDPVKATIYRTFRDEDFHETLYEALNEADLVIGYNHDKFDLRHINREFVEAGYAPPRPFATVDMLKVVKQRFNFPHNKLSYVASVILGETKLETGGFDLWPSFMEGDQNALKIMRRYNIKDTVLTEKLYKHLRPWVRNHPYIASAGEVIEIPDRTQAYHCPACGSNKVDRERPRFTRCFAIRQLHCQKCEHWFDGRRMKL